MQVMARPIDDFAPKISSGIDAVDRVWGGLYEGGAYMVYGRVSNGRGLVSLLFSQIGAALDEKTLYVSTERSKDLIIQAASIGFDIRKAHRLGIFKLVRTTQLLKPHPDHKDDKYSPFDRLMSQVRSYAPTRLVLSDPSAFAGDIDPLSVAFRNAYARFLEQIEPLGTTVMLSLPEPASDEARRFTEFVMSMSTAGLYVGKRDDEAESGTHQLTLIPQIGHITRHRTLDWDLSALVARAERVESTYKALQGRIAASGGAFLLPEHKQIETAPRVEVHEVPLPPVPTEPPAPTEVVTSEPTPVIVEREYDDEIVVPHQTLDDLVDSSLDPVREMSDIGAATAASDGGDTSIVARVLDEVLRSPEAVVEIDSPPTHDSRAAFSSTLQTYFDAAAENRTDFLVVAMRVDAADVSAHEFAALCDSVAACSRDKDALFSDPRTRRLVLLMPESSADQAQALFASVKARLKQEGVGQGGSLLSKVSAIVVPNGNPFENAESFLGYVLDSE